MHKHIHLIASAPDMIAFIRDFKKFTSKAIRKNIIATEPGTLSLFEGDDGSYELWAKTNMPKAIESEPYCVQKIDYIHNNPVRKQYVKRPEGLDMVVGEPRERNKDRAVVLIQSRIGGITN